MQHTGQTSAQRSQQFSVYLGDGAYVSRAINTVNGGEVQRRKPLHSQVCVVEVAQLEKAAVMCRSSAVRACHQARAVGLAAWLVPAAMQTAH